VGGLGTNPTALLTSFRGSWKTSTFKKYNFEAEGIPPNGGALHPLLKVREEFRNIFMEMGYGPINFELPSSPEKVAASPKCPLHSMWNQVSGTLMPYSCRNNIPLVNFRIPFMSQVEHPFESLLLSSLNQCLRSTRGPSSAERIL